MRTTFSTLAVMASSLLVKEALAAPAIRARDYYLDTDNVIVTEEVWVTELADGSYATGVPVAVGTITIDGSAVLVTEPVPSATILQPLRLLPPRSQLFLLPHLHLFLSQLPPALLRMPYSLSRPHPRPPSMSHQPPRRHQSLFLPHWRALSFHPQLPPQLQ